MLAINIACAFLKLKKSSVWFPKKKELDGRGREQSWSNLYKDSKWIHCPMWKIGPLAESRVITMPMNFPHVIHKLWQPSPWAKDLNSRGGAQCQGKQWDTKSKCQGVERAQTNPTAAISKFRNQQNTRFYEGKTENSASVTLCHPATVL